MREESDNGRCLTRAGEINAAGDLRADEQAILQYMRTVEHERRPGILIAFYNGSNWVNYERPTPRWLARE